MEQEVLRKAREIILDAPCPQCRPECQPLNEDRCKYLYLGPDTWIIDRGDFATKDNDDYCWKREILTVLGLWEKP